MLNGSQYELVDFGQGRKLERFGAWLIDRPAPQATAEREAPLLWAKADARFDADASGQQGTWSSKFTDDFRWTVYTERRLDAAIAFELRLTPYGQVGLFPEQAATWEWLEDTSRRVDDTALQVLNLFAYTGASTLAVARAGARVVHVDAARSAVNWARRNTELSGLADRPIRWIVDDALAFLQRERRRHQRYDGFIIDPPSFGRGPRGRTWQFEKHLDQLLESCQKIWSANPSFCVVTCHTTGWSPSRLAERVRKHLQPEVAPARLKSGWLELATRSGRTLPSGVYVRWSSH